MDGRQQLLQALEMLGQVLDEERIDLEIVVAGGGALLLAGTIDRPTQDLDAVACMQGGRWRNASPLPQAALTAVRKVALALGLSRQPRDEKDWLNGDAGFLFVQELPSGFAERASIQRFGRLIVHLLSRQDLISLKLLAATAPARLARRQVDLADLRALQPSKDELREAVLWCELNDGRPDHFELDIVPALLDLGIDPEAIGHG